MVIWVILLVNDCETEPIFSDSLAWIVDPLLVEMAISTNNRSEILVNRFGNIDLVSGDYQVKQ